MADNDATVERIDRIDKLTWAGAFIIPALIGWLS